MSTPFNRKLSELLGKMDEKVVKAKLNAAMEMLKNGDTEELAKKMKNVNKDDLMDKINEYDRSKIEEMNIDIDAIKRQVTEADLAKLSALIGDQGDDVVRKIKKIFNEKM